MSAKQFSQITDVGLQRSNNEDCILSDARLGLWLVADGMGGHAAGEVASEITRNVIRQCIADGLTLKEAINKAHQAVLAAAKEGAGRYGMGSTVVALHALKNRFQIAWVGDSRAYLWSNRNHDGYGLQQLTIDHSYVQMLYQSGIISAEEMAKHPDRNVITQCLGSLDLGELQVDLIEDDWHPNDWILLCSDGLSDIVNDQQICDILNTSSTPRKATQALLKAALASGGKDNISIIVVKTPPIKQWLNKIKTIKVWGTRRI